MNDHTPFKNVLPFQQAKIFARKLHLNGAREWKIFIDNQSKKLKIPARPDISPHYKNQWISWGNFLGKENKKSRKYSVDDDFFKKWSHDMAYIFGLWFADGCIIKHKSSTSKHNGNVFNITQYKDDKYLLDEVAKTMGSGYPVYKNRTCFFIQIVSTKIVEDIIRLGGKYRKSLNCKFPYIPKKYLHDFIRGLFDGDGCIYFNCKYKFYRAEFCSGSKMFMKNLFEVLSKNIPNIVLRQRILSCKSKKNNKISKVYNIYCYGNSVGLLRDFMYKNNPRLKLIRKYEKFQKIDHLLPKRKYCFKNHKKVN